MRTVLQVTSFWSTGGGPQACTDDDTLQPIVLPRCCSRGNHKNKKTKLKRKGPHHSGGHVHGAVERKPSRVLQAVEPQAVASHRAPGERELHVVDDVAVVVVKGLEALAGVRGALGEREVDGADSHGGGPGLGGVDVHAVHSARRLARAPRGVAHAENHKRSALVREDRGVIREAVRGCQGRRRHLPCIHLKTGQTGGTPGGGVGMSQRRRRVRADR